MSYLLSQICVNQVASRCDVVMDAYIPQQCHTSQVLVMFPVVVYVSAEARLDLKRMQTDYHRISNRRVIAQPNNYHEHSYEHYFYPILRGFIRQLCLLSKIISCLLVCSLIKTVRRNFPYQFKMSSQSCIYLNKSIVFYQRN